MRELLEECLHTCVCHNDYELKKKIIAELTKPEPEPVAWMYEHNGEHWFQTYAPMDDVENYIPLYTNPPAHQNPVKMSDEEIVQITRDSNPWNGYSFARAVEMSVLKANGSHHEQE